MWAQIPAQPLTSCVTRSEDLSESLFPHPQREKMNEVALRVEAHELSDNIQVDRCSPNVRAF